MVQSNIVAQIDGLSHQYDQEVVLGGSGGGVSLDVAAGEIVTVLGPNGSGKTTLFRLLCTLMPIQNGTVTIGGFDASSDPLSVRSQIGIVFQSPSLDAKLTVDENLMCQAALYGIRGEAFTKRRNEALEAMGLVDRRNDFCGKLSGGLKRRVEIAKTLLHQPRFLLLDEPSTGLDPSARLDLWDAIEKIAAGGTAVLMTTHLLEEADRADRVILMAGGCIVATGSPSELRSAMGEGLITIAPDDKEAVRQKLEAMQVGAVEVHGQYRFTCGDPASMMAELIETLGPAAQSITVGRPSLEDVFIAKTGEGLN